MVTFDDKSEGKRFIHRPKTMFTKYFILSVSLEEKLKFQYYNNR